MTIEQAKEFLILAETLNYSSASRELFISQPTLSRHIQLLEKELGFRLVNTSSHSVSLTKEGEDAVLTFRKIVKEYDRFCERGKKTSTKLSGKIRLGLLYYSIEDDFSDFIPEFNHKYPEIKLEVVGYQPHQLYEDLLNGKLDVGQVFSSGMDKDGLLQYQKIKDQEVIAMLRKDHPLAKKKTISFNDLKDEKLIVLTEDTFSREQTDSMLKKSRVRFENIIEAETIESVPHIIRKNGGVHITGGSVRKQGGKDIIYIPISDKQARTTIYLACLKSNTDPLAQLLMEEAKSFFQPVHFSHI